MNSTYVPLVVQGTAVVSQLQPGLKANSLSINVWQEQCDGVKYSLPILLVESLSFMQVPMAAVLWAMPLQFKPAGLTQLEAQCISNWMWNPSYIAVELKHNWYGFRSRLTPLYQSLCARFFCRTSIPSKSSTAISMCGLESPFHKQGQSCAHCFQTLTG